MRPLVVLILISSVLAIAAAVPLVPTEAQAELSVTFDDLPEPNRVLADQYPTGVIDWGSEGWYLSGPWGLFTTNSIGFNGPLLSSASFTFVSPRRLVQFDAYNGGPAISDIELSCDQMSLVQLQLGVRQLTTIVTGWTDVCTTVTVSSSNGWNTNFDNLVIGDPLPTPTPTATATSTPSVTPTVTPTSTPTATETAPTNVTVDFDDLANPNRPLSGEYPIGVIDWGTNSWYLSGPFGLFRTNSIGFNGPLPSGASFTFVNARRLVQVDAYNGGPAISDIELSCDQVLPVQLQLGVRQLTTIVTGWTDVCTTVTVSSSNGWNTNFDNLVIGDPLPTPTPPPAPALTPTETPTAVVMPTLTETPTSTETASVTPSATATATSTSTSMPTVTSTSTSTPSVTPTGTSTSTSTPSVTPTGTPTMMSTATATPTATPTPGHVGSNHQIAVGPGFSDVSPHQLVRTPSNVLYVVVPTCDSYPSCPGNTLRVYRADQAGLPSTFSEQDVAHRPAGGVGTSAIAIDGGGLIHVVWNDRSGTGHASYAAFDTTTNLWRSTTTLQATGWTSFGQGDEGVALAIDAGGQPHAAWNAIGADGALHIQYATLVGGTWTAPLQVDDVLLANNHKAWHPTFAFTAGGDLILAWLDGTFNQTPDGTIHVRVRQANGTWIASQAIPDQALTSIDNGPSLLVTPDSVQHLAFLNGGDEVRYWYNAGAGWSGDLQPPLQITHDPSLGPDGAGGVYIYGHGAPPPGDPTGHGDNLYRFHKPPGGGWSAFTLYTTGSFDSSVSTRWSQFFDLFPEVVDIIYWSDAYPNVLLAGVN